MTEANVVQHARVNCPQCLAAGADVWARTGPTAVLEADAIARAHIAALPGHRPTVTAVYVVSYVHA